MIQKPKIRFSKYYTAFVVSLLFVLVSFFVYATQFQVRFFSFLAVALTINIILLFLFYRKLKQKKSELKIQREDFFEKANLLKVDLKKEENAISAFRLKILAYSKLKGLVEKLSMCLSLGDSAETLCREISRIFEYTDTTVILYQVDGTSGELGIVSAERAQRAVNIKSKKGDLLDHWVMKSLQPVHLEDTHNDFRFDIEKLEKEAERPVRSVLCAPLIIHHKLIGILRMDSPVPFKFHKDDLRFLSTVADVAAVALENAVLYDKVEDMATRDSLTGLYLRRYLIDRLQEEIIRHHRREKPMAFLMFDLDHFKKYNDTFGHAAGDLVLKHVSSLMQEHFKNPGNLLCRYGGEEFCVILSECSKEKAILLAENFVKLVENEAVVLRREKTPVTVSGGLVIFPDEAKTKEELIQRADQLLYEAKRKGRNRLCWV